MSGSSGGFSGDTGGFSDSCEDLTFIVQLSSPKIKVIQELKAGVFLDIEAIENALKQPIIVAKYEGEIAGGITHQLMFKLLTCIRQGTNYQGEVLSIFEAQVKLKISIRK